MKSAPHRVTPASTSSDDREWFLRSQFWAWEMPQTERGRTRRSHEPLIICGHGAALSVRNNALLVRDGFTHYPQKAAEYRFFPRDPEMPSRIVLLDGSGSISFDALDWLGMQDVPLIRINWRGEIQSVLGARGYSADPRKVDWQRRVLAEGRQLQIGSKLIDQKLANCIATLKVVVPSTPNRDLAVSRIDGYRRELRVNKPKTLFKLLSIEGQAAIAYFAAWREIEVKWEETKRKPIPKNWSGMDFRSSTAREKSRNRNASHPVNAMLNYAYAILRSHIQIKLLANGYDPRIGYLHAERDNRSALVLDTMEPLRPIVDRQVVAFVQNTRFSPADFSIRSDGACRLHPDLARRVVSAVSATIEPTTANLKRFEKLTWAASTSRAREIGLRA